LNIWTPHPTDASIDDLLEWLSAGSNQGDNIILGPHEGRKLVTEILNLRTSARTFAGQSGAQSALVKKAIADTYNTCADFAQRAVGWAMDGPEDARRDRLTLLPDALRALGKEANRA